MNGQAAADRWVASPRITALYRAGLRRRTSLLLGLWLLLGAVAVLAVNVGAYDLAWKDLLRALAGLAGGADALVVWQIRMPRVAAAVVSGWALGLTGLAVQSLLKNPLASPFTLGISQGAAFGAAFAIVVVGAGGVGGAVTGTGGPAAWSFFSVSLFALAGALATTAVILVLAVFNRMAAESIILAGVALSSLFLSGTILVQYFATETEIATVVFWTFGDVARSTWREILVLFGVSCLVTAFFVLNRWNLNALAWGEDVAKGLGVRVDRLRLSGMFLAALAAALVTAFHGVIAFLGLLAPHIGRRLVGADHRLLVPCSCLTGALLLLAADTLGRCLPGGGSMPVGVLTSFMGAPLFLYLLIRRRTP